MNYSLISVRYAKALFSLSKDKGIKDSVYKDMCLILGQYSKTKELQNFLESPVVPIPQKRKMFVDVFEKYVNEVTIKFLMVLLENNREALLDSISRDFIELYKSEQGIKTITLFTAVELDKSYLESIKETLSKELDGQIELNVVVREHLIGGFMLMLDGKLIDTSISTKLKKLRKQLLN